MLYGVQIVKTIDETRSLRYKCGAILVLRARGSEIISWTVGRVDSSAGFIINRVE